MPISHAIVLGIVQGLTEFLPVSSSAHLALLPWLLGWQDQGLSFDIALHIGTLAAMILYFFKDWLQVLGQGFGLDLGFDPALRRNKMLLWWLVLASIPAGVIGLLVKDLAENVWRYNQYLIGTMFIVIGIFMWWADKVSNKTKDLSHVGLPDALTIGTAQALALVPGTSRSGITISTGLLRHLDRPSAARFSFLLATPATAGAALKDFYDLYKHGNGIPADMQAPFVIGILVSGITGIIVIQFFLNFLRKRSLNFFVTYRIVFGIMVIALATFFRYSGR